MIQEQLQSAIKSVSDPDLFAQIIADHVTSQGGRGGFITTLVLKDTIKKAVLAGIAWHKAQEEKNHGEKN